MCLSSREAENRLNKYVQAMVVRKMQSAILDRLVGEGTSGQKQSEGPDVEMSGEGRSSQVLRK